MSLQYRLGAKRADQGLGRTADLAAPELPASRQARHLVDDQRSLCFGSAGGGDQLSNP